MASIPANNYVNITPSVLGAGGAGVATIGLLLTTNTRFPIGTVQSFASYNAVVAYAGASSTEANLAAIYFAGYVNSLQKPASLLIAQAPYNTNVSAYLRGGSLAGMTLATLQGFSGILTMAIDGATFTTASINLSAVASFSLAAAAIQTALQTAAPTTASVTGGITGTTLTVSAAVTPGLLPGQVLTGTGVTAGTTIVSQTSGTTGGIGVYVVTPTQTVSAGTAITAKAALPTCTFDAISQAFVIASGSTGATSTVAYPTTATFATGLALTAATNAVLSQGYAWTTPAAFMNSIVNVTTNWASFATIFEPGSADKVAFAAWVNAEDQNFLYAMWDTTAALAVANDNTSPTALIIAAGYSGTAPFYQDINQAIGCMGFVASLPWGQLNGRATLAYKSVSGITPNVTSQSLANILSGNPNGFTRGNGCNYYGAVASASSTFQFFYPGYVTGPFLYIDSYVNQIWLNSQLQAAMLSLFMIIPSVPYNQPGYDQIKAACQGPITAALNYGAIRTGVTLSDLQIAALKNAAGLDISSFLFANGYYLQVVDPGSVARNDRNSPICNLWYTDGSSVQAIQFSSVDVL